MKKIATTINGCFRLEPNIFHDERGRFVKVYRGDVFRELGLEWNFAEEYYSVSKQRVLRGLHFQIPPKDCAKLVYCVQGSVLDVAVDLRADSSTYGEHLTYQLSADNGHILYFPTGIAHGFYTLSAEAILVYKVTSTYSQAHDTGILWNSVSINWPDPTPLISERDRQFIPFSDFTSPFTANSQKK